MARDETQYEPALRPIHRMKMNSSAPACPGTPVLKKTPLNVCPNCGCREPHDRWSCAGCGTTLRLSSLGKVAFWVLGDIPPKELSALASSVEMALGVPVVVQPGRLDPQPSLRPKWKGRSGNVILRQLLERHSRGTLTNVAIVADNVVSDAATAWLFGYAYVGWPSALLSFHLLKGDQPGMDTLVRRARSVCLHEIGHNLDLPDHPIEYGTNCCMIGEVDGADFYSPEAYPADFCPACQATARERLKAFAEVQGAGFKPAGGKVFAQRYELITALGEGGMGLAWKAHDLQMDQDVVLKFVAAHRFDGSAQVSLKSEAAQVRRLSHPHIIRVFDLAADSGIGAVVMDWIDGCDLAQKLERSAHRMLDPGTVAAWAGELCAALDYAHRQGVVHQDVKPHNCLIDRSGKLVLADFGLSRPSTYRIGQTEVFHTRGKGTLGFSAPEQFTGSAPCPAHDVYAFGATLFYLLTGTDIDSGTRAAGGFPNLNALRAGRNRRAVPVDSAWQEAIRRCLMREPRHRPRSMAKTAALFGFPAPEPTHREGWFEKVSRRLAGLFRRGG